MLRTVRRELVRSHEHERSNCLLVAPCARRYAVFTQRQLMARQSDAEHLE